LASAPLFSSASIIFASPWLAASHSGVEPLRLAAATSAPASSNSKAKLTSPV
jgi:hypothetical protein